MTGVVVIRRSVCRPKKRAERAFAFYRLGNRGARSCNQVGKRDASLKILNLSQTNTDSMWSPVCCILQRAQIVDIGGEFAALRCWPDVVERAKFVSGKSQGMYAAAAGRCVRRIAAQQQPPQGFTAAPNCPLDANKIKRGPKRSTNTLDVSAAYRRGQS